MIKYSYKYKNKNTYLCICIHVSIPGLLFKYTIDDMQNEKDYLNHYNEFVYNQDYVIILKYKYIYIITCICVRVYLLFGVKNFTIYKIVTIFDTSFIFN